LLDQECLLLVCDEVHAQQLFDKLWCRRADHQQVDLSRWAAPVRSPLPAQVTRFWSSNAIKLKLWFRGHDESDYWKQRKSLLDWYCVVLMYEINRFHACWCVNLIKWRITNVGAGGGGESSCFMIFIEVASSLSWEWFLEQITVTTKKKGSCFHQLYCYERCVPWLIFIAYRSQLCK
jgi:hypothetical protein